MANSDTTKRGGQDDPRRAAAEAGGHAREAASAAGEAAELTYEELRDQLDTLRDDLVGLVEAARSAGVQGARKAYGSAQRAGRKVATAAGDGYEIAEERVNDAYHGAEDFVRERPAVSMGLAAGGGFLLAMWMTRR